MASIGDVAAQIRAACKKAEESRSALEQAEDLAEEAHAGLAGALAGVTRLEADVAAMPAEFARVKDGCNGYLWPLITETLKAAESIADRLAGEGTAAPAAQRPAPSTPPPRLPRPPPIRRAESADPPVIPPQRVDQLRHELPPPITRASSGQKTHGRWIGPDGTVRPIVSGKDVDSESADELLEEMDMPGRAARAADVEMKLAARMVREGIPHATVVINYSPCRGRFGCDTLVPILLPEGATLTVHGVTPKGQPFRKRYTGGARPWWR